VLLTPLDLYAMPLLRYAVGDVGSPAAGACACGRGLPLMQMIQGRVQDLIVTRSGRHLTGVFFAHLLKELDVERFQVVQESLEELDFYLVPGPTFGARELDWVRGKVLEYTGGEVGLRLHLVEHIPLSASGKHRVTVSKVATSPALGTSGADPSLRPG
jgi:phenylacetate-CoA ligase